jgi:putative heme iron utilization protein
MAETSPIRPTDDEARALAAMLMREARTVALGVIEPGTSVPMVTRIAIAVEGSGVPVALVSGLSQHTAALRDTPSASLLFGEPGAKGDPLTHPRLTLVCRARFVAPGGETHGQLRSLWLARQPKAKLYIDFGDFAFVRFDVQAGHLNGGFGQAFRLEPADLGLCPPSA